MEGDFNRAKSRFNANNAFFELTAGATYHFKGSNGKHHFTKVRAYNQTEIDQLNASINNLRTQVNEKNSVVNNANQKIGMLQQELADCRNRPVKVETVVETSRIPESIITFRPVSYTHLDVYKRQCRDCAKECHCSS